MLISFENKDAITGEAKKRRIFSFHLSSPRRLPSKEGRLIFSRLIQVILLVLFICLGGLSGVAAQSDGLFLNIIQIDSGAFPQITAYVTVSEASGLPVTGLTAADFSAFENGTRVTSDLNVESVTIPGVQVVLAVDLSTPPDSLEKVKIAAKALVETLTQEDRLALLAFYNESRVVQDFTNDNTVLQSAVTSLTQQGDYTTLYRAIFDAATMLNNQPPGRKAIIVLTDKKNNIGNFSLDQALNLVQEVKAPLYVFGLGETKKIVSSDLQDLNAPAEGRMTSLLAQTDDLQPRLVELVGQLRQGYRLTYHSPLKADGGKHELVIGANWQDQTGQAKGPPLITPPGEVTIILPDLANGQTVGGVIGLKADVTAAAPVAWVEYRLDGQPLQKVNTAPYRFDWDSSTALGLHTLTARAVDRAGNEGQIEVQLKVVEPLVVQIATVKNRIERGDSVAIQATINAITEISGVELWLDDRRLASAVSPPYGFTIDSDTYTPGEHVISVQARDKLGRTARDSLTLQFVPPPPPWQFPYHWLRYLAIVLVILLAALLLRWLLITLLRRKRPAQKYALQIANLGNARSRYKLRAEDPAGLLRFQFAINGALLDAEQWPASPLVERVQTRPVKPVGRPQAESVSAAPRNNGSPARANFKISDPTQPLQQANTLLGRIGSFLSPIVNLIGLIASVLPKSIGYPIQQWTNQVVGAHSEAASRVSYQQSSIDSARSTVRAAADQFSSGTSYPSDSSPEVEASPVAEAAPETPAPAAAGPERGRTAVKARSPRPSGPAVAPVVLTPVVEAGQTLALDLLINPVKPNQTQEYVFTITSQSVEQEGLPPVVETSNLSVVKPSWLWRLGLLLIFIIITVIIILLATLLVFWLLKPDRIYFF